MPNFKCYPITNPNSQWNYCPSFGAAILFSCLFGITTIIHLIQAIVHKKSFAWVIIMAAAWETAGYIFRILSVESQLNSTDATAQQLLILLAPLWINAFAYMTTKSSASEQNASHSYSSFATSPLSSSRQPVAQ